MAKKSLMVLVAARWELPKPTEKAESNLHGRAASDFCRNAVQIRETAWPPRKADDGGVGSVHFRLLPASRVAVSVQMCDDTAVASQAGHIILFKSTHSQPSYCVIPHYVTLTLIFALFLHFLLLLKCSLLLHHISSCSVYLVLSRYFFCVMFAGMLFPS